MRIAPAAPYRPLSLPGRGGLGAAVTRRRLALALLALALLALVLFGLTG